MIYLDLYDVDVGSRHEDYTTKYTVEKSFDVNSSITTLNFTIQASKIVIKLLYFTTLPERSGGNYWILPHTLTLSSVDHNIPSDWTNAYVYFDGTYYYFSNEFTPISRKVYGRKLTYNTSKSRWESAYSVYLIIYIPQLEDFQTIAENNYYVNLTFGGEAGLIWVPTT